VIGWRQAGTAVLLAAALGWAAPADAGDQPARPFLVRILDGATAELATVIAERPPPRRPPVPVKVAWQARRLASLDLGAPLLALAAVPPAGDGRAQLLALTTRELLLLTPGATTVAIAGRMPLPTEPPAQRPRDPVGTLAIAVTGDGAVTVRARASEAAEGATYALGGGGLAETGRLGDFPLCTGGAATLVPGRNYLVATPAMWPDPRFADAAVGDFFAIACADRLVDADGWPLAVMAVAGTDGRLLVQVRAERDCADAACTAAAAQNLTIPGVGTAVAVADVDRDGRPEVITAGAGAPGDPDQVSVYTIAAGQARRIHQKSFTGGVVGLVAADVDGNGAAEVFAAVRLLGSNRVDLWTLD